MTYIYNMCVCVCVCVCVRARVCVYIHTCSQTHTHANTCMHAYMHTYIHTYTHTDIHTDIHTYLYAHVFMHLFASGCHRIHANSTRTDLVLELGVLAVAERRRQVERRQPPVAMQRPPCEARLCGAWLQRIYTHSSAVATSAVSLRSLPRRPPPATP